MLLTINALSQHPWYYQMTTYDGLPSNTVYWMLQDSKGYMWFGTENGLTRYDGVTFKIYEHDDLMSYDFNSIHEDSKGNIWSHNFANQLVKISNDSLTIYEHSTFTQHGYYMEMALGDNDNIYIKNQTHLFQYFPEKDTIQTIFQDAKLGLSFLSFADSILAVLVMDLHHPTSYLRYNEATETVDTTKLLNTLNRKRVKTYQIDADRMLMVDVINAAKNIYTIKNDSIIIFESLKKYDLTGAFNINNIKLLDGDIWYCTTKGAVRQKDGAILLPDINIANMLIDKDKNIWISSLKEGVFVLPNLNVQLYTADNSNFPVSVPTSIALDEKGNLFVGTTEGSILHLDAENKKVLKRYDTGTATDISAVFYDKTSQHLWSSGFFQFKKGKSQHEQMLFGIPMKQAFALPNDELLIRSSRYRLSHFNAKNITAPPKQKFSPTWIFSPKNHCLSSKNIRIINSIHYDAKKDRIWMALQNNTIINTRTGIDTFFLDNKTPLSATCFEQSLQGDELWIGTHKSGFIVLKNDTLHIDHRGEQYKAYKEIKLIKYGKHRVWILAKNALLVVDHQGDILRIYDAASGVPTHDITDMAIWGDKAWLCTKNGLLSIDYEEQNSQRQLPKPFIRSIQVEGKLQELENKEYNLSYDKNTIQINFSALSTSPKSEFKYRYRLNDLDKDWQIADTRTGVARYSNLAPDTYVFELQTLGKNGKISKPVKVHFNIASPIWKKLWFILLCILFTISVLWFFYKRFINNINIKNYYNQQLRESQLVALKAQMNPHFMFNSLNSIQEFIILNEKRLANEYLSKFSKLMRVYLNHSNKDWVMLDEEIDALRLYLELEQLRFEDAEINLTIDPKLNNQDALVPPLFIQPYVENAFKHGLLHKKKDRKLDILFQKKDENILEIIIEDNGIGREKAMQIKKTRIENNDSFSTTANQQRLNLLNYSKKNTIKVHIFDIDKNNIPSGTKVIIHIPIYQHYE